MKFVCDRCQTKYSIADDRVRGKVLKVKCKTCGNVVTVREARRPSAAGLPTLATAGRISTGPHGSAAVALAIPPVSDTADESERTQLAPNPMLLEGLGPPHAPAARRRSTGPLPPLGLDDDVVWYMALDGKRTGPFSKHQLVDRLVPLARNADVHIWNEKLGDWKPPSQVAAVATELAARKKAPPPPPLPGAPRRPTPPPIPPLAALSAAPAGQPRRPTPHASALAPAGTSGAHARLPPPGGAGVQRPGLFSAAAPASAAPAEHGDPLSLLETPAPQPHMHPGHTAGTNGRASSRKSSSDVLQMLNLPGGPQTSPGAAPRLMSLAPTVTWGAGAEAPATRSRNARLILVFLGVIAVICVVVVVGTMQQSKKNAASTTTPSIAPAAPVPEKVVEPPPPPPVTPPPIIEETPPPAATKGKGKATKVVTPKLKAGSAPAAPVTPPAPADTTGGAAARFRDTTRPSVGVSSAVAARPPPNQADITKVIGNNRASIKACYQRALLRDNTLTHGKIAVKLSIGISGRVKQVSMEGPQQFRALEPCIKEVVQRWVFPQASEEYGTEFPLVFQGNE